MPDPLTTSAISWGLSAAGWLISPVLSRFLNKCFDALGIDLPPQFQSRKRTLLQKLENLQTTLLPKLLILTDAAQQSSHRQYLEKWIQKLKSAYYETEHVLGLVEYERLEKKVNSLFPSTSKFNFMNLKAKLPKFSSEKKKLIASLENLEKIVTEGMEFVSLLNLPSSSVNSSNWRANKQYRETISTPDSTVIGRDKDRDDILNLLEQDSPESVNPHSVIAIWGMGGLGKTTLAQYVCEHVKEKKCFEPVMWVHVSENFNIRSIMEKMWESVQPDTERSCPPYESLDVLISHIREKLKDKKYLLVLDDVWCNKDVSQQELNQLFAPLNCGSRGSKILVTTRNEQAARALGAWDPIKLRELDGEEFLSLFTTRALSDVKVNKQTAERLREIGVKIAKKLCRSPLAAITVAGQLRRRPDPEFWESVRNRRLLNDVMGALYLSYQNLHPALQRCFAFCSLFPKGHWFNPDELVNLWIGEGFIETEDNDEHMKDIANRYFLELVSGSFFQFHTENGYYFYTMHDIIHDLAQHVSEGECFRIVNEKNEIPTHTRHLNVVSEMLGKYVEKICKIKDLRTIISTRSYYYTFIEDFVIDALFINLRKLRVVHLNYIRSLPKSMIHLKNLRYLVIIKAVLSDSVSVSESLNRLYQLRVLNIPNKIEISDVGRLILLQELREFHVKKKRGWELKQLEHLTDLYGKLYIYGLHNVERKEEARQVNLSEKKGLRYLELSWDTSEDDLRRESDVEILDGLCPPPQLKKLVIKGYSGKRLPNWILENNDNIIHLKHLTLVDCNGLESLSGVDKLSDLQSLHIFRLPRLKSWVPPPINLTRLKISGCLSLAFALNKDDLETIKSVVSTNNLECNLDCNSWYGWHHDDCAFKQALSTIANELKGCLDKTAVGEFKDIYGDLYLPPALEDLSIELCIITDRVLAGSLQGLNSLTHLTLNEVVTITCITDEVLCSLTSLTCLDILACYLLTSIGGWDTHGTLEKLKIVNCPNLTVKASLVANSYNTVEQASSSCKRKTASCMLKTVYLHKCSPLDDCFQNLVSTEELTVRDCPTIVNPHIGNLRSLIKLQFDYCSNLISLSGLSELNHLEAEFYCYKQI